MARSNQKERDLGYIGIMKQLEVLDRTHVDVGIQEDAGDNDGTAIAEYAFFNEYGTANIPERSFMRSTFDENVSRIIQTRDKLVGLVLSGRMRANQAARLLGEYHEGQIKRKIGSGVPPPNAPATIKAKGSSKTLIDTGAMRQAVRYEVRVGRGSFRSVVQRWRRGRR